MPGFAALPNSGHRANRQRQNFAQRVSTTCIVDSQGSDYRDWQESLGDLPTRVEFLASAEDALRRARQGEVSLWVVNTQLPGISGFELCPMLRAQCSRAAVYLVADEYTPEIERAAWQARATMFAVKPLHDQLLRDLIVRPNEQPTLRSNR